MFHGKIDTKLKGNIPLLSTLLKSVIGEKSELDDILNEIKDTERLDRKINLSQFSSNCYKDFKEIFQKEETNKQYVGYSENIINTISTKLKIN